MPVVVEPNWTGRRVSVRRVVERAPDGRLLQGDVVGELVSVDAQTAVVETAGGLVEVPLALVTAARLVAPSTRDDLELQGIAARALRAQHSAELDGWLLRADPGRPRRANSVLPRAQLRLPLDEALSRAHDWYAALGKPVLVQVPYPARRLLDAALDERGWTYEAPSQVLVAGLDRLARPEAPAVRIDDAPDDAWLAATGGDRALLTRHDTVAFASVRDGARVVAAARGCVDGGWLALSAVVVEQSQRRRGHATRLSAALAGWATGLGARRGYLQVERENTAALALYTGLGFWLHHEYHYRREPRTER